jgi:hypothetical protein
LPTSALRSSPLAHRASRIPPPPRLRRASAHRVAALAALAFLALPVGCGKKGPPLAPLNLAPEAPGTVTARRLGDTVYLKMTVPAKSVTGTGAYSVDHLEVYAVTLAPGTVPPPNRDFLKPAHVIATIPIAPPLDPEAAEPDTPETRPIPGGTVTFVEKLTPETLKPQDIAKPVKTRPVKVERPNARTAASPSPAAPAAPAGPLVLTRVYTVRGVSTKGNAGQAAVRVEVPLLAAPGPARLSATPPTWEETKVTITWQPPASSTDEAPGVLYNVYATPSAGAAPAGGAPPLPAGASATLDAAPVPLNPLPFDGTTFASVGATPGLEKCFVVRSVATVGTAAIESEPSEPICVTPRDIFPPAAPKNLQAVGSAGVISLIWEANTEPDVAGYLVLRGPAPGDTLQPLTPAPIRETRFQDRTTSPGVTYVYAIVAVDRATPPNRSAPSNRVQETAR